MSATLLLCSMLMFAPTRPEPVAPVPDQEYSSRVNRAARGVGIGFGGGLWGKGFGQSLHIDVPFGRRIGQFFGLRAHGTVVHLRSPLAGGGTRWDGALFGGLELFGRSPVMGGIARAYGGGGVFIGGRPVPTPQGAPFGIAGGGHMGLEVFISPRQAFYVQIGGQGPVHALAQDAGVSVLGGMSLYFGR